MRTCEHCGTPLARRANESPADFAVRRYCGRACVDSSRRRNPQEQSQRVANTLRLVDAVTDDDERWKRQANCLGVDPDLFYPGRGEPTRDARQVCAGCTVRADCLAYALRNHEKHGIWGGLSERERERLRRELNRRVAS